eukprot:4266798-Prymnesium_polylepis.1
MPCARPFRTSAQPFQVLRGVQEVLRVPCHELPFGASDRADVLRHKLGVGSSELLRLAVQMVGPRLAVQVQVAEEHRVEKGKYHAHRERHPTEILRKAARFVCAEPRPSDKLLCVMVMHHRFHLEHERKLDERQP